MYSDMSKRTSSTPICMRELSGDLRLADAGGPGEQEGADRLVSSPRPERDILMAEDSERIAAS
jgi:hypothetical protein